MSFYEKCQVFFLDMLITSLLAFDVYMQPIPPGDSTRTLLALAEAAEYISFGDTMQRKVLKEQDF